MASEAQLAANRSNARKSTGPRTPVGKAVVARNGIKHGLLSREYLVKGESEADLGPVLTTLLQKKGGSLAGGIGRDRTELLLLLQASEIRLKGAAVSVARRCHPSRQADERTLRV